MKMQIGYEIVEGKTKVTGQTGFSFRIRGLRGIVLTDCPLWFKSRWTAVGCAEHMVAKAIETLRQKGIKATPAGT